MSKISRQQQADLAVDAYNYQAVTEGDNKITIGGHDYKVLAVHNNRGTGYQGTVYQDLRTKEIIVAHRGTEEWRDGYVDWKMVANNINRQFADSATIKVV